MSPHVLVVLAVALLTGLTTSSANGQELAQGPAASIQMRLLFEGETLVRGDAPTDSARVDIRLWSIAGGQRIAALELPFRGLMIVELRGGRVTTIMDDRRVERHAGEIWSVPAESNMQLETGDDMATLQTTIIAR